MVPTKDLSFPIGIFEDAGITSGDVGNFKALLDDAEAHALDAVMFTNNFSDRDERLLDVSDERGFEVYMLPGGDLNVTWWPDDIPATSDAARDAAQPIVRRFSPHSSFGGYIVKDEPALHERDKVALLTRAFHDLDPERPAMPILIGVDRAGPIFAAAQPDVMLIDVYPVGYENPLCDFTMTGFGYPTLDFVGYVRQVTQNKPATTPLWIILQTHRFMDQLRQPLPVEVRAQNWLAIGEGATGIFWFIYSSQQGWTGLADNPALFSEVEALARRVRPLRHWLIGLQKGEDRFAVAGPRNPYVSTLRSADGRKLYAVAVNRDCEQSQSLSISSSRLSGRLRDLESPCRTYALDLPIRFPPGDGKIFELVSENARCAYLPIILRQRN